MHRAAVAKLTDDAPETSEDTLTPDTTDTIPLRDNGDRQADGTAGNEAGTEGPRGPNLERRNAPKARPVCLDSTVPRAPCLP